MAAVVQSPPHEIARQEKLAHLAAVDAREELQRRHSQGQADAGAEAERQARVAAFGEAPQASPLVKAISAGELEKKATTQQVKALAEEERAQRMAAEAERERVSESERKSNAAAADRAAEGERQERLQAQAKADAQEALVRAEAQRRSLELQDAERAERLAAGPQRSPLKGSKVLETVGDAAAELERKGNARRVDAAAEEERERRVNEEAAHERASETERLSNAQDADKAAEAERSRRVAEDKRREADAARERQTAARKANKAMDAERADRVAAHGTAPLASPSSKAMKSVSITPRPADAPPPPPEPAQNDAQDDFFTSLGLDDMPATRAALASAYRRRVLVVHPDKQMQKPAAERLSPEEAKRLFVEATFAYEFLKEAFDDDDDCE
mmetsp:Transcript_10244/g.30064  ORF Transcript_10244/g.30064 Transcript_10244/m.30064 type:complete len:387 (-) Transcript_10244:23-1183(-)